MEYVELMKAMNLELAAEYLVMAAMLGEIKSRTLLPRPVHDEEDEAEDPRAELIRRLQEYERFKQAAEDIDLRELLLAFKEVLYRADMFENHQVSREKLSTRERMANVLDRLKGREFVPFVELFEASEGRLGVVVSFLAILELVKGSLIELVQSGPFSPIHVKARTLVLEESEALAALELDDEPYEADEDE